MLPSINLNINNSMSVEMLFSMNAEVKLGLVEMLYPDRFDPVFCSFTSHR